MREYLLGLATLPALAVLGWLLLLLTAKTNTFRMSCGCGKDWGNPAERGWRIWWEPIVVFVHDRTRSHRSWRAAEDARDQVTP